MDAPLKRLASKQTSIDAENKVSKDALIESIISRSKGDLLSAQDPIVSKVYSHEWIFTSNTWKTLTFVGDLPEHQLWFGVASPQETDIDKTSYLRFRFDNDTTQDCNEFWLPYATDNCIEFDGPNNDGGPANGVILVGRSYVHDGAPETVFYLFKQHGLSAKDYRGPKKIVETQRSTQRAFWYHGFPFSTEPIRGHTLTHVALAGARRGLIGTCDAKGVHHLSVFDYVCKPHADDTQSDHSFEIEYIAHAANAPHFKKIGWIYGKTLLGITRDNELYIIALDIPAHQNSWGQLRFIKQKTARVFKDFAISRPDVQHEVLLIDESNHIFHINLKQIGMRGNLTGPYSVDRVDTESALWAKKQKDYWNTQLEVEKMYQPIFYQGKIGFQKLFSTMICSSMSFMRTHLNQFACFSHKELDTQKIRELVLSLSDKQKTEKSKNEKRARKK